MLIQIYLDTNAVIACSVIIPGRKLTVFEGHNPQFCDFWASNFPLFRHKSHELHKSCSFDIFHAKTSLSRHQCSYSMFYGCSRSKINGF